jgi:hypothetical protein
MKRIFFYVAPKLDGYQMIFGYTWLRNQDAVVDAPNHQLVFNQS